MGFSEKYDESLYSDKEKELICEIIEKFKINKDNILCDTKNKYHFKTGFKRGTYPNLENYFNKENKKKYGRIKVYEGKGSPGGKYRGSGGFDIEWEKHDQLNNSESIMRKNIEEHLPLYKKNNIIAISKKNIENTRRPITIDKNGNLNINNNSISNISDLNIHFNDHYNEIPGILFISQEYISQKSSDLVTFINTGVKNKDCFPIEDIQNNNIQSQKGKIILRTLGINEEGFCNIFNNYYNGKIYENENVANKNNMKINFTENLHNKSFENNLKILIRKSMGDGDSIISHYTDGKDNIYRTKDKNIELINYHSYYGGKSKKGKRIDVEIKTKDMSYTFNLRNKQGGIYPSHLMCDFKHHNDQM
tara:strand:+ start:1266 stop:2354 length:1089 start_codon:yes stop_codon:yes gene_type:complete